MAIWPKLTVVVDATSRARTAAGLTATELLRFAPKKKKLQRGLKIGEVGKFHFGMALP